MSKLSQLTARLEQLAQQAAAIDRQRGEQNNPLFDEILFSCRSKLLVPCVDEAKSTCAAISRESDAGMLTAARAEYLTERLLAQISAIQREISTQEIRRREPKQSGYGRKPINQLYQDLAQHQDWERRLQDMVREKELAVEHAAGINKASAQQALLATEKRLQRCQAAKHRIEKQITYRERKH
ncbi:primosomal replication protein PriC [Vibrio sp.]|uniref:primosomal replication protein PriC n=1 Tax=Vibrio sp. TaxID=678 RepID=UPI003D0E63A3